MITLEDFYRAYGSFRPLPNDEQREAIEEAPDRPLFIVAGPGSGKTTCLTLRILKLILVDGIPPNGILATTFTVKAAAELRSRILGWGFKLLDLLKEDSQLMPVERARVSRLDLNQVVTGTIDSICEQVLRLHRDPGVQPPVLVDDFVAKTLMLREGLLSSRRFEDPDLDQFLLNVSGGSKWGWNVGAKNNLIQAIWDRRFHDQVGWEKFVEIDEEDDDRSSDDEARRVLSEVISSYENSLTERGFADFAVLEQRLLERLCGGQLTDFLSQIRVVLVDEYQDTNLLQERIYFELAKGCGGALSVVGDDDQSLYRFRGATVGLFRDFADRYRSNFQRAPRKVFLKTNYRSSRSIVDFVNGYAGLDPAYQSVRVVGKPELLPGPVASVGVPVLAMFRPDVQTLGRDLATFIHEVFRGSGVTLPDGTRVERHANGGDLGDCAVLCSSPAEYNGGGDPRLPSVLRSELGAKLPAVEVFNPRGQDLEGIDVVGRFGGLLLECLDPGGLVEQRTSGLAPDVLATFQAWRRLAVNFASGPGRETLLEFAMGWANRDPQRSGWSWPKSVPVLDLVYGLVHFFPELHDDPEGQVYLEVFTRQVGACELIGKFKGRVVTDPTRDPEERGVTLSERSIMELYRTFLGPIASGTIKVNEELMETFPRDRLSILSVHQSKGLEFPLVVVDVGSDFKSNHQAHAFKRFPSRGGPPHSLEDLMRPYTALGPEARSGRDRAFDDLYRQFFVAFSRPQDLLLIVGLDKSRPGGAVRNVGTGWSRDGVCPWQANRPFVEI